MKYLSRLNKKELSGKTCLLRVDLNIKSLKDQFRIDSVLPTIKYLLRNNVRIVILSHRGRPTGIDQKLSLKPIVKTLSEKLKNKIEFIPDFNFDKIRNKINSDNKHAVFMLENLRFLPGEEKNDAKLARQLSGLGDFYINDAFAVCHRQNASTTAITKFIKSYTGLLLEKEIENLTKITEKPKQPLVFIIGGAKTESKLPIINNLFQKTKIFLLGGVIASTFMAVEKKHPKKLGRSLVDKTQFAEAVKILSKEKGRVGFLDGLKLYKVRLPPDVIVAKKSNKRYLNIETVYICGKSGRVFDQNKMVLDIGPETIKLYSSVIKTAGTIVFVGPMGLYEIKEFSQGTKNILKAITKSQAFKVAGGGETVSAISQYRLSDKFDYISTGGGAMLDFLAGKKLPGIKALK